MEGFTYVDIFATKGVEYLLVIGFLALFVPFWKYLSKPAKALIEATKEIIPAIAQWFRLPVKGIYYHQGHSWAMPEGDNVVKVGIDDFAQKLVGKVKAVEVPKVGATLNQGGRGWTLKVDSKSIDMLSPVGGKVLAVNKDIINAPEKINDDPYGEGWLAKVEVPNPSENTSNLLSGQLAQRWMEGVREDLSSKMDYNLGTLYQDGGLPVNGMAKNLDPEKWDELAKGFFLTQ